MLFIVIDGKKYKVDPTDSTKALLDAAGNPVPYEEPTPAPENPPAPTSLEEKAKSDPELARLLQEKRDLEEAKRLADEAAEADRQEQLRKAGDFQKLAEEAEAKRQAAEKKRQEAEEVLNKYKTTVTGIRDEMLAQIPEEKRSLIPDGSAHAQIDYIKKNSKFLGVSFVNKGSEVPPNEDTPPLDEEAKLNKEFTELLAKPELTRTEQNRLNELSTKLKEIRARKQ